MYSSPFDLLSTEIMQEIFLSCLPEDEWTVVPPISPKNNHTCNYVIQLVISQVSSRWRSIALNTLQLWDNFLLSVKDDWQQAESALRLASLWLDRVGSLPITLSVWIQHDPHIQDFLRLISSHRFKSLVGDLKLFCLPLRNKSYEESFASLESLSLDIPNEFSVDSSPAGKSPDGDNYCQLPSLRCLRINFRCINVSWQGVLHMIPWHQLTKLTLDCIKQVSTVIKIIRECKALVECRLSIVGASYTNEDFISPSTLLLISHPKEDPSTSLHHLRSLRLSSDLPISDLIKVLLTFKVPNLTSIYIMFAGDRKQDWTRNSLGTDLLSQLDEPTTRIYNRRLLQRYQCQDASMPHAVFAQTRTLWIRVARP